jgi:hypothetical protein
VPEVPFGEAIELAHQADNPMELAHRVYRALGGPSWFVWPGTTTGEWAHRWLDALVVAISEANRRPEPGEPFTW